MAKGGKLKLVKWHLGEEELSKLEQLKSATSTSMAEHTRRAINLYFETLTKTEPEGAAPARKPGPLPMVEVALERTGNVLLCGASRSGKTWAMKPWIARSIQDGDCVVVVDTCIGKELLECALQSAYQNGRGEDLYFFDTIPAEEDIAACFAEGTVPVALFHFENTFILHTDQYQETLDYLLHRFVQTVTDYASRTDKPVHIFIDEAHRVLYPEMAAFIARRQGSNIRAHISVSTLEPALANLSKAESAAFLRSFDTKYFFRPASPLSLEFARTELMKAGLPEERTRPLTTLRPQVYYSAIAGTVKAGKVPEMQPLFLTMNGTLFKGSHTPYPVSVVDLPTLCKTLHEKNLL